MRVLLGGEGQNELGSWANQLSLADSHQPGVVEALLLRVDPDGWAIEGAVRWKRIRKYKPGMRRAADTRNVLGLVHLARERGFDLVAFVRDRDDKSNQKNTEREKAVEDGIRDARELFSNCPEVVGGVAAKRLESWIAACLGKKGSEELRRPEEVLERHGISPKKTADYARVIQDADLKAIPDDAHSLRLLLKRAKTSFTKLQG